MITLYFDDNLKILQLFNMPMFDLIYVDPPFNTKKKRVLESIETVHDNDGDRIGYQGKKYKTIKISSKSYDDCFEDYIGFLQPRFELAYNALKHNGSFFVHVDYREVHYVKVMCDKIFGRENFMNEIIWSYDYGARSKSRWPAKHDNILWYVKDNHNYTFNYDEIDRIPYLAPNLVGKDKAKKGKTLTDVWWNTIVPTSGKEKTGYPTQKPESIISRIVKVHSNPGDNLLDFFAGSGTLGIVAEKLGRNSTLIDNNAPAIETIIDRIEKSGYNVSKKF